MAKFKPGPAKHIFAADGVTLRVEYFCDRDDCMEFRGQIFDPTITEDDIVKAIGNGSWGHIFRRTEGNAFTYRKCAD